MNNLEKEVYFYFIYGDKTSLSKTLVFTNGFVSVGLLVLFAPIPETFCPVGVSPLADSTVLAGWLSGLQD